MRTKLEEKKQKNIFQGFFFKIISRWRNQAYCGFLMGKRFPYSEIVSVLVKKTGLIGILHNILKDLREIFNISRIKIFFHFFSLFLWSKPS